MASRRESKSAAEARRASRYDALESFDRRIAERGFARVAGVDEVGRGALAGPVVCAAVMLPPGSGLVGVDDSKSIDAARRDVLFERIVERALCVRIAVGQPDLIDRENILNATLATMHRAVAALRTPPDVVLVDGRDRFHWSGPLVPITRGDSHSLSIAAASIVAKVARDRLMCRIHARDPRYHFDENKGYGTADHIEAINRHGPGPVHRRTFLAKIVEKNLTMF